MYMFSARDYSVVKDYIKVGSKEDFYESINETDKVVALIHENIEMKEEFNIISWHVTEEYNSEVLTKSALKYNPKYIFISSDVYFDMNYVLILALSGHTVFIEEIQ